MLCVCVASFKINMRVGVIRLLRTLKDPFIDVLLKHINSLPEVYVDVTERLV